VGANGAGTMRRAGKMWTRGEKRASMKMWAGCLVVVEVVGEVLVAREC
jgi:hypothetical protein